MHKIEAQRQAVERTTREDLKGNEPAKIHRPWNYKSQSALEQEVKELKEKRHELHNRVVQLEEENAKLKRELNLLNAAHADTLAERTKLYNQNQGLISASREMKERLEVSEQNELKLHRKLMFIEGV